MTDVPRYDLHLHSHHSYDCLMTPRRIVRTALRRGLAGVAVTDHGTIAGGLEAKAIAQDGLFVIVGAEIYTKIGDIVCLFLTREITSKDPLEVIAEAHRQGGIAFLPHPLRSHPRQISEEVLLACDGYEELNSRAGWFISDAASLDPTDWRALMHKPRLGCSDAHLYSEIGRAYPAIPGPVGESSVRRAFAEGATTPGGERGPSRNFYLSQLIRLGKTRDLGMLRRFARRLRRRLS